MTVLIALLKECLAEVGHLKQLHYGNQEWVLWRHKVQDALEMRLGAKSEEMRRFQSPNLAPPGYNDYTRKKSYLHNLESYATSLASIIQRLDMKVNMAQPPMPTSVSATETLVAGQLRIFIAHDGDTGARGKLEDFIRDLGAQPVVAEGEPTKGRGISEKVDTVIRSCHYAVVIATCANASTQNGRLMARGNVINELPRIRELLGNCRMVALEHGVELPSNESASIYENFSPQSMDSVFSALVRELRGHGLLKVGAPDAS